MDNERISSQTIGRILSWKAYKRDGTAFDPLKAYGDNHETVKNAGKDTEEIKVYTGNVRVNAYSVITKKLLYQVEINHWINVKRRDTEDLWKQILWIYRDTVNQDFYYGFLRDSSIEPKNIDTSIYAYRRQLWLKPPISVLDSRENRAHFVESEPPSYRLEVVMLDAPSLAMDTREAQIVRSKLDDRMETVISKLCVSSENSRKHFRDYVDLLEETTNKRLRASVRPATGDSATGSGLIILKPVTSSQTSRVTLSHNGNNLVQRTATSSAIVSEFEVVAGSLEEMADATFTQFSSMVPPEIQLTDKSSVGLFGKTTEATFPRLRSSVRINMSRAASEEIRGNPDSSLLSLDKAPSETDMLGLVDQVREVTSNATMSLLSTTRERTPTERFAQLPITALGPNQFQVKNADEFAEIINSIQPWMHPNDNTMGTVSSKLWEPIVSRVEGLPTHRRIDEAYVNRILQVGESPLPMEPDFIRLSRTIVENTCKEIKNLLENEKFFTLKPGRRKSDHYQPPSVQFGFQENRTANDNETTFSWSVGSAVTAAIEGLELCSLIVQQIVSDYISQKPPEDDESTDNDNEGLFNTMFDRIKDAFASLWKTITRQENTPDETILNSLKRMFPAKDTFDSLTLRRQLANSMGKSMTKDFILEYLRDFDDNFRRKYIKRTRDLITHEDVFLDSLASVAKNRWKGFDFDQRTNTAIFDYEERIPPAIRNGSVHELFTGYDAGSRGVRGRWIGPTKPTAEMLCKGQFRTYDGPYPEGESYLTRNFDSSPVGRRIIIPAIDITKWLQSELKRNFVRGFTGWHHSRVEDAGATTYAIAAGANFKTIRDFFDTESGGRKRGYDTRSQTNKEFTRFLKIMKTSSPESTVRELGGALVENGMVIVTGCTADAVSTPCIVEEILVTTLRYSLIENECWIIICNTLSNIRAIPRSAPTGSLGRVLLHCNRFQTKSYSMFELVKIRPQAIDTLARLMNAVYISSAARINNHKFRVAASVAQGIGYISSTVREVLFMV